MRIDLNQFEQLIDQTILKRGFDYFKGGAITHFTESSNGAYEAIVSGTETYTVQLEVNNHILTKHVCTCPYDWGPVCKHIVAAIFYLKQGDLTVEELILSKPKKKRTTSVTQEVKDVLKAITHKELAKFVQEHSKKDKKFRNYFLASFGHLSQNQSKESYQKQIHSILDSAAGRDGWIYLSEMNYVVNTIAPFLENAKKDLTAGNFENVFFVSTALLEEVTQAFEYGDDSNGDLGNFIDCAMELLSDLVQEKLPKPLKEELFQYCITAFKENRFQGWDWHLGMLHIAGDFIDKESEATILMDCLESVNGDYERQIAQSLKLDLLRRFKTENEVAAYIEKNIANSSIRTKEIERAYESNNFNRVIKLSQDGIACDQKDKPGLVKDWYNWLLKAAQSQNDTVKIIEYSRFLFIDNFYPKQDYYKILKETIPDEEWPAFIEELIKEITSKNKRIYTELVRKIYIREERWDRLFVLLKQNLSMENIQKNEQYLSKDYSSQLIELYSERIIKYVERYVGRSHYQTACRYLRRMKKLGGDAHVAELIQLFRKQYPQRSALMDELTRV